LVLSGREPSRFLLLLLNKRYLSSCELEIKTYFYVDCIMRRIRVAIRFNLLVRECLKPQRQPLAYGLSCVD
jgi:hypothetical protein